GRDGAGHASRDITPDPSLRPRAAPSGDCIYPYRESDSVRSYHRPGSPCPRCTGGTTTPALAGSAGALAPAIASRGSSAGNRRTAGGDSPLDPSPTALRSPELGQS